MNGFSHGLPNTKDRAITLGIALFIALATISNTVTTLTSYAAITAVRVLLCVLIALAVLFVLIAQGINFRQLVAVLLFTTMTAFGAVAAAFNLVSDIGLASLFVDWAIITAGLCLIFADRFSPWPTRLARWFVSYALIVVLLTFFLGGINFDPVPRFNLEYGSELIGRDENYSLGISFFFGFASIAALLATKEPGGRREKVFFQVCCFAFLLLSFIGGGRGEFAAAALILAVILMSFGAMPTFVALLVAGLVVSVLGIAASDVFEQFAVLERFRLLFEGDLSSRDLLLLDAINLLSDNPRCLLFGCGFGFFQSYHMYDKGLYPHNSIVEAVIVFGLPVVLVVGALFLRGLYLYLRSKKSFDLILGFTLYSGLVSLKSQYLYSCWIFMVSVFYFSSLALPSRRFMLER